MLKIQPDNQTANILMGQIYNASGNSKEALLIWQRMVENDESRPHPEAAFLIAKYYSENTNDCEKVTEMIKLEMKITNNTREESHYILITSLLTKKQYKEARSAFNQAKRYFPSSIQIESLSSYFAEDK